MTAWCMTDFSQRPVQEHDPDDLYFRPEFMDVEVTLRGRLSTPDAREMLNRMSNRKPFCITDGARTGAKRWQDKNATVNHTIGTRAPIAERALRAGWTDTTTPRCKSR